MMNFLIATIFEKTGLVSLTSVVSGPTFFWVVVTTTLETLAVAKIIDR